MNGGTMFPAFPKSIYLIFPYADDGTIAGVYVGSSGNAAERIKRHVNDRHSQLQMHDLMRKNGYDWIVVDVIHKSDELHLEFDWMDFFRQKTDLHLFNIRINYHHPNWQRIGGVA